MMKTQQNTKSFIKTQILFYFLNKTLKIWYSTSKYSLFHIKCSVTNHFFIINCEIY